MQAPHRAPAPTPALHRLLARLGDAAVAPPVPSLSARLSQWLDWTHAVALSSALDARPATPSAGAPAPPAVAGDECARVRAALAAAITGDRAFAAVGPGTPTPGTGPDEPSPDYAFFRQRYVALQQVMEADISHLRGRLRGTLARQAPPLGPLVAMDAVMERALGRQERAMLATLPDWLGQHFERLRNTAQASPPGAPAPVQPMAAPAPAWLKAFCRDMQSLLLAELDIRLQPSEGLVAALRATSAA